MSALLFFMEFVDMAPRVHNMWYEGGGIHEESTFGDFFERMFWQRIRLNYDTFRSLIRVVGPSLE